MNYLITLVLLFNFSICIAQTKNKNSVKVAHENTIYDILQKSWVANEPVSYLAPVAHINSVGSRRIPLREGENRSSNFYLFEANINLSFPLFFGKKTGGQNSKRSRITFDYNGTFRMTLDESKPLTPGSNKVGFSWYFNLYNNYTGWAYGKLQTEQNQMLDSKPEKLKFYNLLVRVHHYSNGQGPGFFYVPDPDTPDVFRNSYLDGDFSTNYIWVQLTKGTFNKNISSLHQMSLAYRYDFGDETSSLAYSMQQEESYGRHRLLGSYDYRTEKFSEKLELHFRTELGYILDNLDNFQANLVDDDNKYRFNIRALLEIAPKNHRAVGYFVSAYYGRDYLNIRYDDIIYSIQGGITLSLDKFFF
ncbi:hypothetical protein [Winogradskyella sp.]|uniref:hypothetical protein n=1 Tax=Winogradskyella sp. TaxID=1883156 RepID=UPI00260EC16C|nr:hypothetical protein [Winogradskyella sp.]